MNRRSVKHTLTMTCLMLVLLASLLLGATSIFSIRNTTNMALTEYESAMDSGYNTEIKSEVQTVIAVLQAEYDKSQAGELTEEEAKAEAKEIVRAMRYRDDGSGYFWIDDTDYNLVMHPILAEQEGNNRYDLEDQNGVMIIQEIMKVCNSADGGGFNEFYFTKADGVTVAPKVAYSELFAPWGWAVSTGNYVDDMQVEMTGVEGRINQKFEVLCIVIVIMMAVMLVMAFVWARIYAAKLCKPLDPGACIQTFRRRSDNDRERKGEERAGRHGRGTQCRAEADCFPDRKHQHGINRSAECTAVVYW